MPVSSELLSDMTTPLGAYWKLAHDETYSFLLESVTGGEQLARYSMIGVNPREVMRAKGGTVRWQFEGAVQEGIADPLAELRPRIPALDRKFAQNLPKLCGGAIGMIGYDYVRTIEDLPDENADDLDLDDAAFMVADAVVVFDHAKNILRIIVLADGSPEDYDRAVAEIHRIRRRLAQPIPPLPEGTYDSHPVSASLSQSEFEDRVTRIIDYIGAGDCIQVVPSLRFETQVEAHPLTVYRALRSLNPSPFMYLMRFGDFDVVGASPELLVGLEGDKAKVRPIAGTRIRGKSPEEDESIAEELLSDEKERAEHIMLVDLGRNDLGRVCTYGSVEVGDLMVVERYSHVMHIVSDVHGQLRPEMDGIDLVRASFPAGTLSGAPKVRAMEIIDEMESSRRGLYGGAVGYFSATGDVDLAIAIRTVLLKEGRGYVQAGAGIVWDSVPAKEWEECHNKAAAALRAIELAQKGL
ncbi:MAG: anthranilate synthase component I [Fimbriimonadaceae bacterium]|nr:anthranilate synthase component I [Fimbriimonadaceae bacterium]